MGTETKIVGRARNTAVLDAAGSIGRSHWSAERHAKGPMTHDDVRAIALALPEAVEQDHHGRPSFRVDRKIFATLWSPTQMNVMLDEHGIRAAAEEAPDSCAPLYWGKRLAAVKVDLTKADAKLVDDLLAEAWSLKAPRRLLP